MSKELLLSVKSVECNNITKGYDVIEVTTNKTKYSIKLYFKENKCVRNGVSHFYRDFNNSVVSFCNSNNIDTSYYFNVSEPEKIGILPFSYSQEVFNIPVYNEY